MAQQGKCRTFCSYPEVPEESNPYYFRHSVNGFWSFLKNPGTDATNLVSNPSLELNADGWGSDSGATIGRDATAFYRGVFSLSVQPAGAGPYDANFASLQAFPSPFAQIDIPPGETYYGRIAVRAFPGDTLTIRMLADGIFVGQPLIEQSVTAQGDGQWHEYEVSARNPNAVPVPVRIFVGNDNAGGNPQMNIDGVIIADMPLSIFDGDSLFASWNGPVHASTSTARATTRGWGEEINLSQYSFELIGDDGFGMPPVQLITSGFARRAGASYQRTQVLPRTITLTGRISDNYDPARIHRLRHDLIRDIGLWDITECGQEFILRYQYTDYCGNPIGDVLEMSVEYAGGLEGIRTNLHAEQITLQLVANEYPYWRAPANQGRILVPGIANTFTYEGTAPAPIGLRFRGPMTLNSITNDTNGAVITFGVPGPGLVIPAGQFLNFWTQPGQVISLLIDEATGNIVANGLSQVNYTNSQPGRMRLSPNCANTQTFTLDAVGGETTLTWFDSWLSADSALRGY